MGSSKDLGVFPDVQEARWGDWRFIASDLESDVMDWGTWREVDGVGHLLMQGYSDFHADFVYAGHRLLTSSERDGLGADLERR